MIYQFEACECLNTTGKKVKIPAGTWPVAELTTVSVIVGSTRVDLNSGAFEALKQAGKAVPVTKR